MGRSHYKLINWSERSTTAQEKKRRYSHVCAVNMKLEPRNKMPTLSLSLSCLSRNFQEVTVPSRYSYC